MLENLGRSRTASTSQLVTITFAPKLGADGLYEDTGTYDEVLEAHIREGIANAFHYAEPGVGNGRTFDPKGTYLCRDCNKFKRDAAGCTLVQGKVSPDHGSSEHWENKFLGDHEQDYPESLKLNKEDASYGERPDGHFGCGGGCEYAVRARKADSQGRALFCRRHATRVMALACCKANSRDGDVAFEENEPVTVGEEGKEES